MPLRLTTAATVAALATGGWLVAGAAAPEAAPARATAQRAASDTVTPFPIDLGGLAGNPATYKGLPLGLTDNGAPRVRAVDGVIGVVCIGMSNGNQECNDFVRRLERGQLPGPVNPAVRVANCAVGSHAIERWNDPADDATLWDACTQTKISAAGIRPDQVRVVWHKAASQYTSDESGGVLPPYPDPASDYFRFYQSLDLFATRLAVKLPAVQAVYTSSRSYGGFAGQPRRGEPLSFEEGMALNQWLRDHDTVGGVWYGWGAYLWAPECASGGANGSGVCYDRADYQEDGVHPTASGREKVSRMLDRRFRQHGWYAPSGTLLPALYRP